MQVFFFKYDENTYRKGRAILQIYRVVPQTKNGIKQQVRSLCNFDLWKYSIKLFA